MNTPAVSAASTPNRMSLGNVSSGTIRRPPRLLVYGVHGIGKSTLAAGAEAPIFIGAEDGTSTLPVKRFPQPQRWEDTFDALAELEHGSHSYRTVVLDTLDWLEPFVWGYVVQHAPPNKDGSRIRDIDDISYGFGHRTALVEWRKLLGQLDTLRLSRGMMVILLAHAWIRPFQNPEGEDWDRYEIKLHTGKGSNTQGLVCEWADAVLFATHEQYAHKASKRERARGVSTGARILHTEYSAAYVAKNRYNLPPTLPLDWQSLAEAIEAGTPGNPVALRARIEEQLTAANDDELAARVRAAVTAAAEDSVKLSRIANKLTAQLLIADKETES